MTDEVSIGITKEPYAKFILGEAEVSPATARLILKSFEKTATKTGLFPVCKDFSSQVYQYFNILCCLHMYNIIRHIGSAIGDGVRSLFPGPAKIRYYNKLVIAVLVKSSEIHVVKNPFLTDISIFFVHGLIAPNPENWIVIFGNL